MAPWPLHHGPGDPPFPWAHENGAKEQGQGHLLWRTEIPAKPKLWMGWCIHLPCLGDSYNFYFPGTSSTKDLSYLGTQNYAMVSKNLTIDRMALEAFSYYVHYRLLDHVMESLMTYLEMQGI